MPPAGQPSDRQALEMRKEDITMDEKSTVTHTEAIPIRPAMQGLIRRSIRRSGRRFRRFSSLNCLSRD